MHAAGVVPRARARRGDRARKPSTPGGQASQFTLHRRGFRVFVRAYRVHHAAWVLSSDSLLALKQRDGWAQWVSEPLKDGPRERSSLDLPWRHAAKKDSGSS